MVVDHPSNKAFAVVLSGCLATIVPTKSDSDVILCLQLLSYTSLELARIDRLLVY